MDVLDNDGERGSGVAQGAADRPLFSVRIPAAVHADVQSCVAHVQCHSPAHSLVAVSKSCATWPLSELRSVAMRHHGSSS